MKCSTDDWSSQRLSSAASATVSRTLSTAFRKSSSVPADAATLNQLAVTVVADAALFPANWSSDVGPSPFSMTCCHALQKAPATAIGRRSSVAFFRIPTTLSTASRL
jgi:hypothetical protein